MRRNDLSFDSDIKLIVIALVITIGLIFIGRGEQAQPPSILSRVALTNLILYGEINGQYGTASDVLEEKKEVFDAFFEGVVPAKIVDRAIKDCAEPYQACDYQGLPLDAIVTYAKENGKLSVLESRVDTLVQENYNIDEKPAYKLKITQGAKGPLLYNFVKQPITKTEL